VAGICECGNEPSGAIKCGKFIDELQACQLFKKDSTPWSKKSKCYNTIVLKLPTVFSTVTRCTRFVA
jgi:hypothetical protein